MNIGEAARLSNVSAKMIRYYEEVGLLPEPARSAAGYRYYSDGDVALLTFVSHLRELKFSVKQMSEIVELWRNPGRASKDVKRIALAHSEALAERANKLNEMSDALRLLADRCHGDDNPECAILDGLADTLPEASKT